MSRLQRAVDLAAILSLTANTKEARELAARHRARALRKIDRAQAQLDQLRSVLAMFPTPAPEGVGA